MFLLHLVQKKTSSNWESYILLLKNNIIVVCLALTLLVSDLLAAESEKQTHRLMILGDSISAGYGLKYSESFPAKLRV